jgi:hypothetical protein
MANAVGDKTVYMQQFRTLLQCANSIGLSKPPDPHRQFVLDLQAWIEMHQSEGAAIILCLDGNEEVDTYASSYHPLDYQNGSFMQSSQHYGTMATLVATCDLVDTLKLHPGPYPSTFAYGKHRLDYIFISTDISHLALRSGVLPLYSIFQGDHNACYVDIDAKSLFNDDTHPIIPPCCRGLQLADPCKVDAYNEELCKQAEYHTLSDKITELEKALDNGTWTDACILEYEKIDQLTSEGMKHSQQMLTRTHTPTFE